jgi:hypothetical protein
MWAIARIYFHVAVFATAIPKKRPTHQLCGLVREEVDELRKAGKELSSPDTRPMREAVLA